MLFCLPIDILAYLIDMLDIRTNSNLRLTCSRLRMLCCKHVRSIKDYTISYDDLLGWTRYVEDGKIQYVIPNMDGSTLTIPTPILTLSHVVDPKTIRKSPRNISHYSINDTNVYDPSILDQLLCAVGDLIEFFRNYDINDDIILEADVHDLKLASEELTPDEIISKREFRISYINGLLDISINNGMEGSVDTEFYDYSYIIERSEIIRFSLLKQCQWGTRVDNVLCVGIEINSLVFNNSTHIEAIYQELKIIYYGISGMEDNIDHHYIRNSMDNALKDGIKIIVQGHWQDYTPPGSLWPTTSRIRDFWLEIRDYMMNRDPKTNIEFRI